MRLSIVALGLVSVASASPLIKRAGGPMAEPITSNCTVINPLPHAACGIGNVDGYMPSAAFNYSHLLYEAFYESFGSVDDAWMQCSEQCYGFGTPGQCKSVLLAYSVPTPPGYYGTAGGVLETACIFYTHHISPNDFVAAALGQYANETVGNIYCPKWR